MTQLGKYIPGEYWEATLSKQFDLSGVAYPWLSGAYNRCLYRAMSSSVDRVIKSLRFDPSDLAKWAVLDVGSGTGFWIDYWLKRGASELSGVDLTVKSVSHLSSKYPRLHFEQKDISEPVDGNQFERFDLISAMSILHHIPSQEGWEQALTNLGNMLRPGGHLLIMDPMLKYRWWGPAFDNESNGRPRTISQHQTVLSKTGLTLRSAIPNIAILADPVDTKRRFEFRVLALWWRLLSRVAAREQVMQIAELFVYPFDRLLCRLNYMPSSKILSFQKIA